MSIRMDLWRVEGDSLRSVSPVSLEVEQRLEEWLSRDLRLTGLELLLVGRQVVLPHGGRIDLLALDQNANTVVLELKRGKTPREVVAQVLDYGSYVQEFSYQDLDQLCHALTKQTLADAFLSRFGFPIPELVNDQHQLVIVAAELDESSERIIQYLGARGIAINGVFFNLFRVEGQELVGRAWLRDPVEVEEQAESRHRAPWSGFWFVNVGEGEHRSWEDNRKYGYLSAGGGSWYSQALRRLQVGDRVFAYMKGVGYVGFGEVMEEAKPTAEVILEDGSPLLAHPLRAPSAGNYGSDPSLAEWAIRVRWLKEYPRDQARTFHGVFANQNIVCKLRHPETVEFLKREFDVDTVMADSALSTG